MKLHRGTIVGPYKIRGPVAEGGMAVLYAADVRRKYRVPGGARRVVLKIANQESSDALKEEAGFLRRFDHPGIVRIYPLPIEGRTEYVTFLETAEGRRPYMVLEYVGGGSLADRLAARGRLPVSAAVQIGAQVARALEQMHAQGVIDRDVKPDNILFRRPPGWLGEGKPRVLLCDLGIALDLNRPRAGEPKAGTFAYMSPEQVNRISNQWAFIDPRSDVFSLGSVLYEMLTGHTPFGEDVSLIANPLVVPQPPSKHRRGIPPELEAIVMQALVKFYNYRLPSAGVMAERLERLPHKVNWGAWAARFAALLLLGGLLFGAWRAGEWLRQAYGGGVAPPAASATPLPSATPPPPTATRPPPTPSATLRTPTLTPVPPTLTPLPPTSTPLAAGAPRAGYGNPAYRAGAPGAGYGNPAYRAVSATQPTARGEA
jgi:serine/threonine protein kinase